MSKVKFSDKSVGFQHHRPKKKSTSKDKGSFQFDIANTGCSLTIHNETRKDAIKKAMGYMGEGFHVKQIG